MKKHVLIINGETRKTGSFAGPLIRLALQEIEGTDKVARVYSQNPTKADCLMSECSGYKYVPLAHDWVEISWNNDGVTHGNSL